MRLLPGHPDYHLQEAAEARGERYYPRRVERSERDLMRDGRAGYVEHRAGDFTQGEPGDFYAPGISRDGEDPGSFTRLGDRLDQIHKLMFEVEALTGSLEARVNGSGPRNANEAKPMGSPGAESGLLAQADVLHDRLAHALTRMNLALQRL